MEIGRGVARKTQWIRRRSIYFLNYWPEATNGDIEFVAFFPPSERKSRHAILAKTVSSANVSGPDQCQCVVNDRFRPDGFRTDGHCAADD